MTNAFKNNKIDEYIHKNLRAYVSDNAAVMLSRKNKSVYILIKSWLDRYIPGFHCNNHKLELTIKHTFTFLPMNKKIDAFSEDLRKLFYTHSNKNLQYLKGVANIFEEKVYVYNRIYTARWIDSSKIAIDNIVKSRDLLMNALSMMQTDVAVIDRSQAKSLLKTFTGKSFLGHLHFFADIIDLLARTGQKMKKIENTIIN